MAVDSVSGVLNQSSIDYLNSIKTETEKAKNNQTLGKDDFLKILITQLTHQDPMEPLNDKESIAQMAQFSSLEQMQNLNATLTSNAQTTEDIKTLIAAMNESLSKLPTSITESSTKGESLQNEILQELKGIKELLAGNY